MVQGQYRDLLLCVEQHAIVHHDIVDNTVVGALPTADPLVQDLEEGAAGMGEEKGVVVVDENHPIHLRTHHALAHVRLEDIEDGGIPSLREVVRRPEGPSLLDAGTRLRQSLSHVLVH